MIKFLVCLITKVRYQREYLLRRCIVRMDKIRAFLAKNRSSIKLFFYNFLEILAAKKLQKLQIWYEYSISLQSA